MEKRAMIEKDTKRLRNLAGKYVEYAMGAPMAQRREKWRLHNRRQEKTFTFHIEDNGAYFRDLMPPLECEDAGRPGSAYSNGITNQAVHLMGMQELYLQEYRDQTDPAQEALPSQPTLDTGK
jgi:hypothetical protein